MKMISRRAFLAGSSLLALRIKPAEAGINNPGSANASSGVTGLTQLGGFSFNQTVNSLTVGECYPFLNFFQTWQLNSLGSNSPTVFDVNGYPNQAPLTNNYGGIFTIPQNNTSQSWVFKWTGSLNIDLQFGTLVSVGNGFVTGGGAGGNSNTTISGTNGRIVFTITQSPFPATINLFFIGGGAQFSVTNMVFCRLSDEASLTSGGIFTPEFLSSVRTLGPGILRQMGWTTSSGVDQMHNPQWAYEMPTAAICYNMNRYPPSIWASTIGGTDTYTCGSYPDMPGTWTDKEVFQGVFTNANTSTTPTINVNGRGAKTIVQFTGAPLAANSITAGSVATFIYDAVLGQVLWIPGGLFVGMPFAIQVALCNAVNAHMWYTAGILSTNAFISSAVAYAANNLGSLQKFYLELSNEVWNFTAFVQTQYAEAQGSAIGLPTAAIGVNQQIYGWYGYRVCQIMPLAVTAWTGAGRSASTLRRVMGVQAFGAPTNFQTYRLNGHDLGSFGFSTFPNRPIDNCDLIAFAPYAAGALMNVTYPADASGATDYAPMTTAADNYASGIPANMASALAFADADYRSATTFPAGEQGNLFGYANTTGNGGNGVYYAWETVRASYDGARPSGKANLDVECYEGCVQFLAPSAAQCTGLNISTTYAAKVATLIAAYQNSLPAKQLVIDYVHQFKGTDPTSPTFGLFPHNKTMAFLELEGPSQWSLLPGDINSTPYQTYFGVQAINQGA